MEMGTFVHACEGEMVVKSTNEKVGSAKSWGRSCDAMVTRPVHCLRLELAARHYP